MLLEELASQTYILTANRRLATYLARRYDQFQMKAGKQGWAPPSIVPMDDWLKATWFNHTQDARYLLSAYQEHVLWSQVIQEKIGELHFIQRDQITHQIQQAWQFLNQWNLSIEALKSYPLDETHHFFIKAVETFELACQERGVIALSKVIPALMAHDQKEPIRLPAQMSWVGFDDFYPQLLHFFNRLKERTEVHQTTFYETTRKGRCVKVPLASQALEIEQVATWAKTQWEINPKVEVGCVFLNLASIQEKVRECFNAVFSREKTVFNFSLGRPLSDYPVIQAALTTLSFYVYPDIELERLRAWLYSPFLIAAQTEMHPRLELSTRLLEQGANGVDRCMLLLLLSNSGDKTCSPQLAAALKQAETEFNETKLLQLPDQWVSWFIRQLSLLGWPGERLLNHEEYQAVQRFKEALDELRQLNYFCGKISLAEAFALLKQLLEMTLFQPKMSQVSPVQVMGFWEASGILFDHLWVSGMSDEAWPGKLYPNPFIPASLQRRMGMPHACAERELSLSRRVTERFFQSAPEVIFSYSPTVIDTPASPSPLIASIKAISLAELPFSLPKMDCIQSDVLETLSVTQAPSVQLGEKVRGGTAILKNQAACPFKAFAQGRLGVSRPQAPSWGLNALDKGNIVHKVLELFWKSIKSQDRLLALDETALRTILQKMLETTFSLIISERPWLTQSLLVEVEKQRIISLLLQWLEQEKRRDFFEVAALESALSVQFERMVLSARMDRMDRLRDGSYVLLDYKTGKVFLKAWEGERPDDPQLPFYWVMNDQPVSAIAFAQIHVEGVQFKGISQRSDILPDVQPPVEIKWDALKAAWKEILDKLLQDFYAGQAQVDPKKRRETCENCGLQTLCRVHEKALS